MKKNILFTLLMILIGTLNNQIYSQTVDKTKDVGEIPMEQNMTPSGAITYNVPIDIYPGNNGLQPNISLTYNSMGGNGNIGMGWNIGGISTISIANSDTYYDGKNNAARKDSSVYVLDGVRLLKDGVDFKTEQGNIIVKDKKFYFEVYYPDGKKATYGFTTNGDRKIFYPITRMEDILGNYIEYEYLEDNNVYYLSNVKYGAKNNTGRVHFASVKFYYNARQDVIPVYIDGLCLKQTKILDRIETYFSSTLQKTYTCGYEVNKNSYLKQLACTANGKNLNPLTFEYGTTEVMGITKTVTSKVGQGYYGSLAKFDMKNPLIGIIIAGNFGNSNYTQLGGIYGTKFGSNYNANDLISIKPHGVTDVSINFPFGSNYQNMLPIDYDGDGNDELIKINNASDESSIGVNLTKYKYTTANGGAFIPTIFTLTTPSLNITYNGTKSAEWRTYLTGDFEGNGKSSLLIISFGKTITGQSRSTYATFIDVEGQKIISHNSSFFTIEPSDMITTMDFDGDGKVELCHIKSNGMLYVYSINATTATSQLILSREISTAQDLKVTGIQFVDMNGDGKTDIVTSPRKSFKGLRYVHQGSCAGCCSLMATSPEELAHIGEFPVEMQCGPTKKCIISGVESYYTTDGGSGWSVYYSNGKSNFSDPIVLYIGRYNDGYPFTIQDINQDGLPDLIRTDDNNYMHVHLNEKGAFAVNPNYSDYVSTISKGTFTIASGDILRKNLYAEVLFIDQSITAYSERRNEMFQRLLTKSMNSLGIKTVHTYSDLYNEALYAATSTPAYPYIAIGGRLALPFTTQSFYGGSTLISSQTYRFTDGVVHRQGLGFKGFKKVTVTDGMRGTSITQTFDPLKFGVLTSVESPVSSGTYNYDVVVALNKKALVTLTEKIERDKLTGVTITTSYSYDIYGNPIWERVDYGNGIKTTSVKKYNYLTGTPYIPGQLYEQTTTSERGGESVVAKALISYNVKNQPVSQKKYYNNNLTSEESYSYKDDNLEKLQSKTFTSSNWLAMEYAYDSYGRVKQKKDALGLYIDYTYNAKGQLSSEKNHKGNEILYEYDDWGRKTKTTYADGVVESTTLTWPSTPTNALILSTVSATGKPTQQVFIDVLGREIRKGEIRFDGNYLYTDYLYDNIGRVQKTSLPFKGASPAQWNSYTYDSYDRITMLSYASGKKDEYTYNNNTVTTKKDNVTRTTTYDATGKAISVVDPSGTITYTYRADSQPSSIVAHGTVTTSFEYDEYGRQTKLIDPSAGTKTYVYDEAGNIKQETDANQKVTITTYNEKNILKRKEIVGELITDYTYNTDGKLTKVSSNNGTSTVYGYDNLMRVDTIKEIVSNNKFLQKRYTYLNGSVNSMIYTTNVGDIATENYIYNNGHLYETKLNNSTSIWKLTQENDLGLATVAETGVLTRTYSYDAFGMPVTRVVKKGTTTLQNFGYNFNQETGNLNWRRDNNRNIQENFTYDNLNRLTGFGNTIISYDNKGNITNNSAVGQFGYNHSLKPYALTDITPYGAAIPLREQRISYNGLMRPDTIKENSFEAVFTYNADRERVKIQLKNGEVNELTRYYIAGQYETDEGVAGTKERLYLCGDAYSAAAVYVKEGTGPWTLYYIGRDYLGSITHIVDASGNIKQELSYDPWGRLRNPANQTLYAVGSEPTLFLGRGYTGHEHLSMFGLINMNARLYDPALGRFLSPDPYIQAPDFSQNFNRYSYCLNNPLQFVDKDGQFIHIIIGAIIGGTANLVFKAISGQLYSFKDGLVAFGIGAAAGGIGAATGGAAFLAAGGGAAGAGGFVAGAAGGIIGSASAMPVQSIGNSAYFGDPMITFEQFILGVTGGGLLGGTINGGIALANSKTFWTGNIKPTNGITQSHSFSLNLNDSKLNTDGIKGKLNSMPQDNINGENRFTVTTREQSVSYSSNDGLQINIKRPDINGYSSRLSGQTDIYHNFPASFDKLIIQGGDWGQRLADGAHWFQAPGTINGTQGIYQIGINNNGTVFHRAFIPY